MTPFARSSAESCRRYTKAPEGRRELQREYESSRGSKKAPRVYESSTGFDRLLFLNMFKNRSRSLIRCQTLVGLRRLRQTFPDLPRWLSASFRKFRRYAADQQKIFQKSGTLGTKIILREIGVLLCKSSLTLRRQCNSGPRSSYSGNSSPSPTMASF